MCVCVCVCVCILLLQYQAQSCSTEYASASVSGTIKPFHDLILAWQPGLASRPSSLCKSPYRTFRKYDPGYILYFCRAGRPSCFVDYFGSGWPAWSRRCVFCGITWHRVQTFPNIYGPTQNHLLLFNAGHIFVPPCRGKHLGHETLLWKSGAVAHAQVAILSNGEIPRQSQCPGLLSSLLF